MTNSNPFRSLWSPDAEADDGLGDDVLWDDDPPPAALTLTAEQRAALAVAIGGGLRERGCDNTLRAARQWAAGAGVGWEPLERQLEDNGGYCDCEVLLNVLTEHDIEPGAG